MEVIRTLDAIRAEDFAGGASVAIGKFDGLHRGHRAILDRVRDTARADGLRSVVFTFASNPLGFLKPEACPRPLMSREQRLDAFAAEGIDVCVMVEFDAAFASIPADEFVADVLVGRLGAKHVVLGGDFRFGYRGDGDGELLRRLGPELGFTVEVVDWVLGPGLGHVSSSKLREAVSSGDVAAAANMLGRPFSVRGEVVHGDARGRELGFPTANLGGHIEGLVPADGVYAGWVRIGGHDEPGGEGGERWLAAISVGNNPTFTPDEQSRVEAFLLDFEGDLYGRRMEVEFAHRLRGTVAFDGIEPLVAQVRSDVERTRQLLAR